MDEMMFMLVVPPALLIWKSKKTNEYLVVYQVYFYFWLRILKPQIVTLLSQGFDRESTIWQQII